MKEAKKIFLKRNKNKNYDNIGIKIEVKNKEE